MAVSLEQARAAKEAAKTEIADLPGLTGIGITMVGEDYALMINLTAALPPSIRLPKTIAGVPLCVEVVGQIRKRE